MNQSQITQLHQQNQQHDFHKNINKLKEYVKDSYGIKLIPDTTVPIPKAVESKMNDKPQKIELNNLTELSKVKESNYIVNIFNHPKRSNSSKDLINDEEDELLYTIKFDKETNKPIVSLIHSTGKSDTALIPTLKCLIVPNRDNMDKPKIIINSHSKEEQFKLILDTGSNVSLINKRLISKEMENHVHKTKAKINFPLLDVKEVFVEQINIQVNNEIHTFFIIDLDIIDVLFGNDILKDSIINQKNKLIKLNNSTYKINYQQSNQLHCNVKAPRKHVTLSNDNQSDPHSILDDDEDIKEQVAKFVESIPSQLCDILAKTNPEEEEIQVLRDFINDSFEDIIVDKLPDIPDQINNSRRGNIIHNIIIKKDQDVEPTKKQIYYSTDEHKRHVEEMVLKFIDLGIIKRSESNYSSPIMLLKKRDSFRVVHDYRQLNKVTVRDDHPFTPVDSLLNQCKDSKLFSKFDMTMGYFQVLINPEHAKYTAFITHIGKFEYTRMPQGLVNSPSTFARLMVEIFGKIKSLLQYFDNLLVHSKLNYMVHFIEIIRMLIYCRKYLLFISREKSEMLKTEVDFLGFHIHKDGISPRAAKVRAISELPEPRNAKEAEAALGLFGFFRRHIENYAEKTYHLSKESKGKNKKTLSDESLKEFNNLKKEFEGENIVAIPIEQDNNTPIDIEKVKASTDMPIHSDNNNLNNGSFHLYCDVSDKALSGVLYQIQGDKFKVIWFHSRKLTDTQKRYSIGDREFLSIIDSLKKFQHLLIGKKRQDNYMKYIKEFDYELRHISGKKNGIADFLSRKYDNFQWDESFLNKIKTRIPMSNIKKIVRDNILDAQINAQKYYNRGRGDVIFVVGEKVMVKRKFFQTNLSKDLISHKLESKNCGPFIITAIHGNNVTLDLVGYPKKHNVFNKDQIVKLYEDTEWLREEISMPEPEEMDEASFEVESILNHDKVKKMYLVKFKGYPEPEWIKEVDTDCEELVREYWNNVQKKQLNSRRERETATIEAVEPIVSSPLSQEVQSSQQSQPITPRHQNLTNTNRNNQSNKRKSRNQNTSSDDELDLSLQITTTRSGRKVTPKRL
ncbi:hypothetical protein ACTFIY_011310 [Dictyostelium cf. discoideum]